MTNFLYVAPRVFPRADYRTWNLFVIAGLWLHLLFVCLSGDLTRIFFFLWIPECVPALCYFFVCRFFYRWDWRLNLKANLQVSSEPPRTATEKELCGRRVRSVPVSSGFPSLCLEIHHYVSVLSSPSVFSNARTCLPGRNDLEPMAAENHPSVIASRLICSRSCYDLSLLIGNITLYLVATDCLFSWVFGLVMEIGVNLRMQSLILL